MDFNFTDEQQAIRQMARGFAIKELAPYAEKWDATNFFPKETLVKAANLGLAGIYANEDIGGVNLSRVNAAIIFEELAGACVSTAAYLSIHNMVSWIVDKYASHDLRQQWGPRLTSMSAFASYCLTEPNSGSDAASLSTTAKREGNYYIVNGSKAFISGGGTSDVYACMVRTSEDKHKGISCLLIDANTPGLKFGKKENKLGWNNMPTATIFFENCRVPVENLVGQEGYGFKIAVSALNGGRVNIGACSIGGAKACIQMSKKYMQERRQFGKKLVDFQALQFKFADMLTDFEMARMMIYRAAAAIDHDDPQVAMYCAMAKLRASDLGFDICNQALQIHGGYGYLREYQIERFFRDLRVHQILEGTNEIMRSIIAKTSLKEDYSLDTTNN